MRGIPVDKWEILVSLPKGTKVDEYDCGRESFAHSLTVGHVTMKKDAVELHYTDRDEFFLLEKHRFLTVLKRGNSILYVQPVEEHFEEDLFEL